MPQFLAVTSRGLIEPLAAELTELKFKNVKARPDGVQVECSWSEVQRLHMQTRLATRVLLPVADFTAYNEEDLYFGVLRKHDFTQYIDLKQSLRVEAKVRDHVKLRDQRFVAMKVKDAVCDQFRKKFNNARPDVGSEEEAALRVVVRVVGPKISLAVDLTGESLSNRGYRLAAGEAPLRENVAAGLVQIAGWKPGTAIVDPFCGSGTILIEAALMAANLSAVRKKREYAFEKLKNYKAGDFSLSSGGDEPPEKPRFFGFDSDGSVIQKARENAKRAGVEKWISFQQRGVKDLAVVDAEPGLLITNPPYGERLEDAERAKAILSDFAAAMKQNYKGWNAWILSGNTEAIKGLRLKAERRVPLWNGPIECRFLHYSIR